VSYLIFVVASYNVVNFGSARSSFLHEIMGIITQPLMIGFMKVVSAIATCKLLLGFIVHDVLCVYAILF
jgi:hypothetical protein